MTGNTKIKSFAHEFLFVEDGEDGYVKPPVINAKKIHCNTMKENSKS